MNLNEIVKDKFVIVTHPFLVLSTNDVNVTHIEKFVIGFNHESSSHLCESVLYDTYEEATQNIISMLSHQIGILKTNQHIENTIKQLSPYDKKGLIHAALSRALENRNQYVKKQIANSIESMKKVTDLAKQVAYVNTDIELWREQEGDSYAPSIHLTEDGKIGINVAGHVIVQSLKEWHQDAKVKFNHE